MAGRSLVADRGIIEK